MAPRPRHLTSLHAALELAMEAPEARRAVIVDGVDLTQAAALLAFLLFERSCNRWDVRNIGRLSSLVSLDGLLRALAADLLPRLIADPASAPALNLISRYAHYILASASAVGGTFAEGATDLCNYLIAACNYLIERADDDTTRRPLLLMRRRAEEMRCRVIDFRSSHVAIDEAKADPVPVPEDPDSDGGDDLHLTSLRQALQEAAAAPAANRRVYIDAVHANHSIALLAVVELQTTACTWTARNLGRLRAAATVAGCIETLDLGLLCVLLTDPNRRTALILLRDFADYIKEEVDTVGGDFMEHATRLCHDFTAHGATAHRRPQPGPTIEMRSKAGRMRQHLASFMSRDFSIAAESSDSDSDSDSYSDS